MRPTLIGLVAAIAVALVLITIFKLAGADQTRQPGQAGFSAPEELGAGPEHPSAQPDSAPPDSARTRFIQELAIKLLETYGETIHSKGTQSKLLGVRQKVLAHYPNDGYRLFEQAIALAFPDLMAEILATLARLDQYQGWLDDNRLALNDLSELKKEASLWEKRRELFGDDAEVIWAHEKTNWARKQQKVQQVIATLDQAHHQSLDETLHQFRLAMEETYGSAMAQLGVGNDTIAQVYFGFESVQDKLSALSPDQRQQRINDVRKQLGYPEEQIKRLQARDQEKNERWENGYSYMARRDELAGRLDGPQLEAALESLREEHFQHEARTIRLEEESGFFRYQRPRLYGRN